MGPEMPTDSQEHQLVQCWNSKATVLPSAAKWPASCPGGRGVVFPCAYTRAPDRTPGVSRAAKASGFSSTYCVLALQYVLLGLQNLSQHLTGALRRGYREGTDCPGDQLNEHSPIALN